MKNPLGSLPLDRWSLLAGLRFFLALVVAEVHLAPLTKSHGALSWLASFGAFNAIVGFLVISGYSVGGSFIKAPEGYLRRRFLRIYPVYFFSILLTAAISCWYLGNPLPSWAVMGWNLSFLNQILTPDSFVGPSWTLALEVWLYCLCPVLLRQSPATLRYLCFGSFTCYVLYSFCRSGLHFPYYSGLGGGLNLIFLSYAWLAGLMIADPRCDRGFSLRILLILFALVPGTELMVQFASHLRHHDWSAFLTGDFITALLHLFPLLLVWLVLWLPSRKSNTGPFSLLLRFLGDVSYPLYLVHESLYAFLLSRGYRDPNVLTAAAVLFSALVYLCIDRYSQRRHLRPALS
jgi:peptidoglycan/LPS O-acetylase OafA/YrhL